MCVCGCVSSGPQPLRGIPVENRELIHTYVYTLGKGGENESEWRQKRSGWKRSETKRMETTMGDHRNIYIQCAGFRSYAIDEIRITEEGKEKIN